MSATVSYDTDFVRTMFNNMAGSYSKTSGLSLGLDNIIRKKAIAALQLQAGAQVCDIMSGNGCNWFFINAVTRCQCHITAVDFAPNMNRVAPNYNNVTVIEKCATQTALAANSMDAVICSFGLKTLPPEKYTLLIAEVMRILKPGGRFVFIELSVPQGVTGKVLYHCYFKLLAPLLVYYLGLGHTQNVYLQTYVRAFNNSRHFFQLLKGHAQQLRYLQFIQGVVSGVSGIKATPAF